VDGIPVNSATNGYLGADNHVAPYNPAHYIDTDGISFNDANSDSWNLYQSTDNSYQMVSSAGNGSVGDLSITPLATPEPASCAAFAVGMGLLALRRRR
jgi:hypothetical protein